MAETVDDFNPAEKFIKIQGGALYLQVKDRLIWARHDHPDLSVETSVVRLDEKIAVFKATASYPHESRSDHFVCGEGHGSETPQGFPPGYIEKAETIAIGRALANLGYGTAAAFEEEDGDGKLADSPVRRNQSAPVAQTRAPSRSVAALGPDQPATERQLRFLQAVGRQAGLDAASLDERSLREFGVLSGALSRRDCSTLIQLIEGAVSPVSDARPTAAEAAQRPVAQPQQPTQERMTEGATQTQLKAIADLWKKTYGEQSDIGKRLKADYTVESTDMLSVQDAAAFIKELSKEYDLTRAQARA